MWSQLNPNYLYNDKDIEYQMQPKINRFLNKIFIKYVIKLYKKF